MTMLTPCGSNLIHLLMQSLVRPALFVSAQRRCMERAFEVEGVAEIAVIDAQGGVARERHLQI